MWGGNTFFDDERGVLEKSFNMANKENVATTIEKV